jgi:thiamine-phosphate pyrophosphorylase
MKKDRDFDLSVYFVADPHVCAGRDLADIVRAAADGGVTMVQLRNKIDPSAHILRQAQNLLAILKPRGIPLIINDHVEIARLCDADGVHVGQDDVSPEEARKILGADKIIGVTAFTKKHFKNIDPAIVDYAGTGPFYKTLTKPDKRILGMESFRELVRISPVPVIGIGGIGPDNAADVIHAGAAGVAMMRSVSESPDPAAAARAFTESVRAARLKAAS